MNLLAFSTCQICSIYIHNRYFNDFSPLLTHLLIQIQINPNSLFMILHVLYYLHQAQFVPRSIVKIVCFYTIFFIHFHIIAQLAWPPLFLTHANTNTLVFTNTGRSVWNTLSERVPEAALSRALLAWATLFVCELNYGIWIMQQRVH